MLSGHKLFRHIRIQTKTVIVFVLLGVLPVFLVGGYGAVHSFFLLNDLLQDWLRFGVTAKSDEVQRFLDRVGGDVLFLSHLPPLQVLINLPPEARRSQRQSFIGRLGEELLSFSQAHHAHYQVRYIDERGWEVVRADYDGTQHYLVPSGRLQDERDQYYFREAMGTPPGQIYVSHMDVSLERGSVEIPRKPVVRYAVPLQSARGEPRGIVIITIDASHILSHVLALGQEQGGFSLASSAGFYLSRAEWIRGGHESSYYLPPWLAPHSERSRPVQHLSSPGPEERLSKDFSSGLAATVLSGKAGTVVEPGLRGRIVAFAPIFPRQDRKGEFWVLLHAYPKTHVLFSIHSFQVLVLVLVLGGGVLVVALVAAVVAARQLTRPITALIQGAEAIAAGDFDHPIRVETRDELEDLARQFTRMAAHLKEHEQQLQKARERAERKAQETHALSQIGMEVLALLSLPQILQLVVDKAREILKGDLATLCLSAPGDGLRLGAVSGAVDALQLGPGDPVPGLTCEKVICHEAPCPAVVGAPFPSHVAVMMKSEDRVVGNLCVAFREPRSVGPDELEFLSGLANQATIAIENARLHREVKELAMLEERERISKDLHDGIIQSIYGTGLGLEQCVRLTDKAPGQVKARLEQLIEGLDVVIRDVRNYVVGLAPERLQDRDLGQALADLARGLALNALLDLDLSVEPGIDGALTPEQVGHLFHMCREALTNVVKHACASQVVLTLGRVNGVLRLSVKDDGAGFDPARRSALGHGLRNMEERARLLGGRLRIESTPGRGTKITAEVPLEEAG